MRWVMLDIMTSSYLRGVPGLFNWCEQNKECGIILCRIIGHTLINVPKSYIVQLWCLLLLHPVCSPVTGHWCCRGVKVSFRYIMIKWEVMEDLEGTSSSALKLLVSMWDTLEVVRFGHFLSFSTDFKVRSFIEYIYSSPEVSSEDSEAYTIEHSHSFFSISSPILT